MMKLQYLFNNPDLAEMLVKNWGYDPDSLDLFKYFRISSNAVNPFKIDGDICFLRFSPISEKRDGHIAAELEWIQSLRDAGYNAPEVVRGITGDAFVQRATPWGEYAACVFKRVTGFQLSETECDDNIIFAYGAALGQLHQLSAAYLPKKFSRWTHSGGLDWIETTLNDLSAHPAALVEAARLREYFAKLPVTSENYGLIHYDFELDNVFYDAEAKSCSVIDFDDAMYHWYMMDITQSLASLEDEIPQEKLPHTSAIFLEGYKSRFNLDETLLTAMPVFKRFANLYQYARVARSIQEHWEDEPDWLIHLREKLTNLLTRHEASFSQPIEG